MPEGAAPVGRGKLSMVPRSPVRLDSRVRIPRAGQLRNR